MQRCDLYVTESMKPSLLFVIAACVACAPSEPAAPPATPKPAPALGTPAASASSSPSAPAVPDYIAAAVAAPERSAADRELDPGRKPAELLAFARIAPGQRVAELGAGGGYTTELLARSVGPKGKVYAQNNHFFLGFTEKTLSERLARPGLENVVRVDREFDDPLPPDAKDLDAVLCVLVYHDTVWLETKRDAMNHAVFAALKPGGRYVIVDHSAREGDGLNDVKTLHRIEESTLKKELESAGFRLVGAADFLRNAKDSRDWNDSPKTAGERRGTSDRFVLAFEKPN